MFCMPVQAFHCTISGISCPVWTCSFSLFARLVNLQSFTTFIPNHANSFYQEAGQRLGLIFIIFFFFQIFQSDVLWNKNRRDDYWRCLYYFVSAFSSCSLNASNDEQFQCSGAIGSIRLPHLSYSVLKYLVAQVLADINTDWQLGTFAGN